VDRDFLALLADVKSYYLLTQNPEKVQYKIHGAAFSK
jgi:hypothetical protein